MNIISFLKLVEIQTKVASVIPFIIGSIYAKYHFEQFNITNAILFFLSLILFDMATTGINNFIDYSKANKKHGYGYEVHNAIVKYNLKTSTVLITIFSLIGISTVLGLCLVYRTSIIVLLIGVVSFGIGIMYSFGPVPISRTPFGEIFSGVTMGFGIIFLSIYIHIHSLGILNIKYSLGNLIVNLNIIELFYIFIFSLPSVFCISNIMLANNICDIDDDIENQRYTLPIYIGAKNSLLIYKWLYYFVYIVIIALVIIQVVPIWSFLVLLTFPIVNKNISTFFQHQSKAETFSLAVKNFVIINCTYIVTLIIGVLFK